jgi:hypothetical protein
MAGVAYIDLPLYDKTNRFIAVATISRVCSVFETVGPAEITCRKPAWNRIL